MSVNKVILIGYVSKFQDVVVRTTQQGKKIANFTLTTAESWKDKTGERKTKYENHRIVILADGLANIVEKYVQKGTQLYIEGELRYEKWTDKAGIERFKTEVVLQGFNNKLEIIENRKDGEPNGNVADSETPRFDDDIPF